MNGSADGDAQGDTLAPAPVQAPIRQFAPDLPLGGSAFPPIADYGFLSDCETVELVLDCEPAFDYGRKRCTWEYVGSGYHEGVARAEGVDLAIRLRTDLRLGFEGPRAVARHRMKEGEQLYCSLSWSEHSAPQEF